MTQRAHLEILRTLAPGKPLRVAIDLILRQGTGALIVLGYGTDVEAISSGGFHLNGADFSPARLAELAKMDGAVICDAAAEVIYRANVHLLPDGAIRTVETGTRHRTAERTAVQIGRPCIVISEGRGSVSVFTPQRQVRVAQPHHPVGTGQPEPADAGAFPAPAHRRRGPAHPVGGRRPRRVPRRRAALAAGRPGATGGRLCGELRRRTGRRRRHHPHPGRRSAAGCAEDRRPGLRRLRPHLSAR